MAVVILCLIGMASADSYVGGLPLTTAAGTSGTVSGGVYMDADNDWWPTSPGVQEVEKTFTAIPDISDIEWARLYVAVYVGHMQNNYPGTVEVEFDGDGDAVFDDLSTTETLDVAFNFATNGGNDNSGFAGHSTGEPYKMVNEHCIRVTSDYVMWYDIDPADITYEEPMAHVTTSGTTIDGRIKLITLVVAYNDGDSDVIHYWVNQGQDAVTYNGDSETPGEGETGTTYFGYLYEVNTVVSATLMVNHMASSDGYYWWCGSELSRYPAGSDGSYSQGAYFGWDIWDLTDYVYPGENNDLMYDRSCESGSGEYSGQFFKIPLAILTIEDEPQIVAPVANFSATPTSGTSPLSVSFADESTNTPDGWTWYHRINGTETWTQFSTIQDPVQSFTTGTYDIRLVASNDGGSDEEIKTSYITVTAAPVKPVAAFSADVTLGYTPLDVQFTDESTNTPTEWAWAYRYKPIGGNYGSYTSFSTEQNASYTFSGTGNYTIRLRATNTAGYDDEIKTGYINVMPAPLPDLDITAMRTADTASVSVFAKETNWVKVTVKNIGGSASTATTLTLTPNDGSTLTETLPVLAAGDETTITFTDTAVRTNGDGSVSVTYTATADAAGTVTEADETNNEATGTYTVVYNGYKGKAAYWEGGSDVTTKKTFDLHGGLLHSFGDSTYQGGSTSGGGWSSYTVTWTDADLPVPGTASVVAAYLYVPYTWDNSDEIDNVAITFNGNSITGTQETHYEDESNFGGYIHHDYGLLPYNVTGLFSTSGNTAYLEKLNVNTKLAMYGLTLAVVYEDTTEDRRQIFLNEEFDLLGASEGDYGTSEEEATAYVPFTGLAVNPTNVVTADLTTFVPSGNMYEGDMLFNGAVIASDVWDYGASSGPQVAVDSRDIKTYLTSTDNIIGIRSTAGATPCMAAAQQFLVLTLTDDVPVANFEADSTTGTTTAPVTFTDTSAGTITERVWDFGDGNSSYSTTETVIPHTYSSADTYDVKLTVTGPGGTHEELKEEYITITEGVQAPFAAFSADKFSGLAPLSVTFTDQSTNTPTEWKWEYKNYNGDWTEFGSGAQSPTYSFTTPGTYDVRLTATNSAGSDEETKTHLVAVSGGRESLTTVQSGTVTGNLSVQSYGLWSATESTKSFTLPPAAVGNVAWARLYVNTYGGSAANTYGHQSTVEFDGNGDGDYLDAGEVLGIETCDIGSETNGNSYPLNDHITKVFSDYEAEYDVTGLITSASLSAHVKSETISGKSFDGRLKTITLVVAYNDPSSTTETHYWVNHGQDWFASYYGGDTGSTTFSTSSLEAGFDTAVGIDLCTSSVEGTYSFNGYSQSTVIPDPTYFAFHTWDLKDEITAGSNSELVFSRGSGASSFKTTFATLAVTYETEAPVAAFTASPTTGDRPLEVTFTDASSGSITGWDLDFGDGSTHGSGSGPWTHTYTTRHTFTATLTVTGPGGSSSDTETITVKEPAPEVTFTADPTSGVGPLSVDFDATNTGGEVTSWKWESSPAGTETWTQFATIEDPQDISFSDGTYDIRVTATGPDYTVVETQSNCLQVGGASIEVGVSQGTIAFGAMQAGIDSTGQTGVTVTTDGGTSWSVTAADGKTENKGYMVSGTTPLSGEFQLSNDGGTIYSPLTSAVTFMSGSGAGTWNQNADVKQAIAAADAPGEYAITVTFTGAFS